MKESHNPKFLVNSPKNPNKLTTFVSDQKSRIQFIFPLLSGPISCTNPFYVNPNFILPNSVSSKSSCRPLISDPIAEYLSILCRSSLNTLNFSSITDTWRGVYIVCLFIVLLLRSGNGPLEELSKLSFTNL